MAVLDEETNGRTEKVGEVGMRDKPNKVTTVLKVVVTGEFYDDDATEETLRYAVEQDLEDAGFDVDVAMLKEQEGVEPIAMQRMDGNFSFFVPYFLCGNCRYELVGQDVMFCSHCGRAVKWDG